MQMMTLRPIAMWWKQSLHMVRVGGALHSSMIHLRVQALMEMGTQRIKVFGSRPLSLQPTILSTKTTNRLDEESSETLIYSILAKYKRHGSKYGDMMDELKSHGLTLNKGIWTEMELSQLQKNWQQYRAQCPIDDPVKVLCAHKFPSEKRELLKIAKDTSIAETLAYMIKRPYSTTFAKAQKLFGNYKWGRFSTEELELAVKWNAMGEKWGTIAPKLNRWIGTVPSLLKTIQGEADVEVSMRWTEEEKKKLLTTMDKFKIYDPVKEDTTYQWSEISARMTNRSVEECQRRHHLNLNDVHFAQGRWTKEEDEKLLSIVEECKVYDPIRDSTRYLWNQVSERMGNRSATQCQKRKYYLSCGEMSKGQWTKEEDDHLLHIVQELGFRDYDRPGRIYSWTKVAEMMENRNREQCRQRYIRITKSHNNTGITG